MKPSGLFALGILMIVFISGCATTQQDQAPQQLQQTAECKPDYILGGTLQKVTGMETNFNASCSSMCDNKYKIKSYRIDKKTDYFYMCYCDINECNH